MRKLIPIPSSTRSRFPHHEATNHPFALLLAPGLSPLISSPSSSPSPSQSFEISPTSSHPPYYFPYLPAGGGGFDFAYLSLVVFLLLLSFVSLIFIVHLRLKSRRFPHLQNFNSLWTVRLLLVFFATCWAVNEVVRLPTYNFPFLPPLTLSQQTTRCKAHVVLSLGFFEPGFLVTLLFLVNISIKKQNPSRLWALAAVTVACSPILLLQTIFVNFSPTEARGGWLRFLMHGSYVLSADSQGNRSVHCTYPTFSCIIFGVFAIAYSLAFLLSCWKVVAFVINKTIGGRINALAMSVMVALPVQILCLGMAPVTLPGDLVHDCAVFAMFLSVSWCVAVGEVILVIKPIVDALAAGGGCCRCCRPDVSESPDRCEGSLVNDHGG